MTAVKPKPKPKRPVLEKVIQHQILVFLSLTGFFVWRNQSGGIYDKRTQRFRKNIGVGRLNGVPDILGILPDGRFLGIEVKSKKGVVRPEQHDFIANIIKRGGVAFVARSVEDVQRELKNLGYDLRPTQSSQSDSAWPLLTGSVSHAA